MREQEFVHFHVSNPNEGFIGFRPLCWKRDK